MNDRDAIAALVSDLRWQIDQLGPRGVKDKSGNPYNPSYYKRGLKNAIHQGGLAVPEYVRGYLYKPPSGGYKKLQELDALDLACESLVADDTKPYAHLFSDEDRAAARKRLEPHQRAIEARKDEARARIDVARKGMPKDLGELRELAAGSSDPEELIAVNTAILEQDPDDIVALNRLGRAYEATGSLQDAEATFRRALEVDPENSIAQRRLTDVVRRRSR